MDYEKLHKDTINRLQQMVSCGKITVETACGICADFEPESEDERIRKALIEMVHDTTGDELWVDYNVHKEDALDWLEKQAEHANFRNKIQIGDKVTRNRDGVLVNLSQLNRVAKVDERQGENFPILSNSSNIGKGEQKPADNVEPKFKVGQTIKKEGFNLRFTIVKIEDGFYYNDMGDRFPFTDQDNWELVEQKPAWSEEDNIMVHDIDYALRCQITYPKSRLDSMSFWIYNLKNRIQPKQEWSEEDEKIRQDAIGILRIALGNSLLAGTYFHSLQASINWLKSLKGRYTWKPSDEQIDALEDAIADAVSSIQKNMLNSLYSDLKKLKGE